jgi:hypothetical protein
MPAIGKTAFRGRVERGHARLDVVHVVSLDVERARRGVGVVPGGSDT